MMFCSQKTRTTGLSAGERILAKCLAVLTCYQHVTDTEMDEQAKLLHQHWA